MAKVTGPFFCSWASGSIGHALTVNWQGLKNRFIMQKYKSCSGPRTELQEHNANVFKERAEYLKEIKEME